MRHGLDNHLDWRLVGWLTGRSTEKVRQDRLDKDLKVLAKWEGFRITRTEFIHGYKRRAQRYPLAGLTASLDDSGGRVSVTVGGQG